VIRNAVRYNSPAVPVGSLSHRPCLQEHAGGLVELSIPIDGAACRRRARAHFRPFFYPWMPARGPRCCGEGLAAIRGTRGVSAGGGIEASQNLESGGLS